MARNLRYGSKPWLAIILFALIAAGFTFFIDRYRHRYVRNEHDLVGLLPRGEQALFYIDLRSLRQAGLIGILHQLTFANANAYASFLRETGFDYMRDVDQLAGEIGAGQTSYFVGQGRYDWNRLHTYATNHGGSCRRTSCEAPTSTPGRWALFKLVQPDVIGLAVSTERNAVDDIRPHSKDAHQTVPSAPVWLQLPSAALQSSARDRVPLPALWGAKAVTVSARPADPAGQGGFVVTLCASYADGQTARIASNELVIETKMLKLRLQREGIQTSAQDFLSLLTSGSFSAAGNQVTGTWKLSKSLLLTLQ